MSRSLLIPPTIVAIGYASALAQPRAIELTFDSLDDGVTLAGTLLVPDPAEHGPGPYPGVVLVTGSGPQDRDSTVAGHKPFLALAGAFADAGIATLRYDDRGVAASTIDPSIDLLSVTTENLANDAESALRILAERREISATGLLGHSEGGTVAAILIGRGVIEGPTVLLAGPTIAGATVFAEQIPAGIAASGAAPEDVEASAGAASAFVAAVIDDDAQAAADALTEIVYYQTGKVYTLEQLKPSVSAQAAAMNSPGMRFFFGYDPADDLLSATGPVLALFGELDQQVLPRDNEPVARRLLSAWPDGSHVETVPGVNHLFQPAETGTLAEYATIGVAISPEVAADIATWLDGQFER